VPVGRNSLPCSASAVRQLGRDTARDADQSAAHIAVLIRACRQALPATTAGRRRTPPCRLGVRSAMRPRCASRRMTAVATVTTLFNDSIRKVSRRITRCPTDTLTPRPSPDRTYTTLLDVTGFRPPACQWRSMIQCRVRCLAEADRFANPRRQILHDRDHAARIHAVRQSSDVSWRQ
jgi:hypothetical protein